MQNRVSDQAAFILRRRDWRNTSLILDLFSLDYGCISVLARGARRNPGKTQYQPFILYSLGWSGKQELKSLTAIEGRMLPVDEQNYLALLYVNELIGVFLPQGEASPEIFNRYLALLQAAAQPIDEVELRRFELDLMRRLGYFPDISRDAQSGAAIDAGFSYQFVINLGFIACNANDRDSVDGRVVLDWLDDKYPAGVRRLAKSVLRSTIDFNLHGKALKSRDVYHDLARRR